MKLFVSLLVTVFFLIPNICYAAVNAALVWEIRTTGATTNGGGFKTGASGLDYSQQDNPQKNNTDLVLVTTTTMTSAGSPFDANDIGNVIMISAGTGFTVGWYEITGVTVATATVDRAAGTMGSSSGTFAVGGAVSTFQDAFFENFTAGNKCWVKAGTYNMTESLNIAKDGTTSAYLTIEGYSSTRGDDPAGSNRPDLQATGSNFTFIFDNHWEFRHLQYQYGGLTGWRADNGGHWINCKSNATANDANAEAFDLAAQGTSAHVLIGCEAMSSNATTIGIRAITGATEHLYVYGCYIHDVDRGVSAPGAPFYIGATIFDNCAQAIVASGAEDSIIIGNTFYGAETPAGTGILNGATSDGILVLNNIFYGWTTAVSQTTTNFKTCYYDYNTFNNNTTDRTNVSAGDNDITLSPQFTDAASDDWSVGANMKAVGFPRTNFASITDSYVDIGAAQRQEAGSSGGSYPFEGS